MKLITLIGSPLRRAITLATVLAVSVGIGVASGAIPSTNGTIYSCFAKTGGQLRVIDKTKQQHCNSAERALAWNQQGVKGDAGRQGLNGQRGAQGPAGPSGAVNLESHGGSSTLLPGRGDRVFAECAPGERVVSGGYSIATQDPRVIVTETGSLNGASAGRPGGGNELIGWQAVFNNGSDQSQSVSVQALCSAS